MSEPAVSSETANRRMSSDMPGTLSDKSHGTTPHAQVANICLPAGERPNKTLIFITGVSGARSFLAWLRASCPGGLTAQLKGDRWMVVLSAADGLRVTISALRSLDEGEGVSFHTITLPEDRNVLRSGRRNPDPAKDRPPNPTSLFRWREGLRCRKCDHSPNSTACECRWSRTWLQKVHCNASAASASDTRCVTTDTRPGAWRVGAPTFPGSALPRGNSLVAVAAGEITRRTNGAVLSGKKRMMLFQNKRLSVPERAQPQAAPPLRKLRGAGLSVEQMDLDEGWNHVRGSVSSRPPPFTSKSKSFSSADHGGTQAN